MELSHINAAGEANMVDVGAKEQTERSALASGVVLMQSETLAVIKSDGLVKGNVLLWRALPVSKRPKSAQISSHFVIHWR